MARNRPLKVYRTSIGFQDAYVAAPSKKAALEAWGTDKDLFARGAAELVTDADLARAALARPGVVLRQSRGTTAQHLAAAKTVKKPAPEAEPPDDRSETVAPPKTPRPSRSRLARAEAALDKQSADYDRKLAAMDAQIARLRDERAQLRARRDREISGLEDKRDREEEAYRAAIGKWQD